jgi:hypothetical protein
MLLLEASLDNWVTSPSSNSFSSAIAASFVIKAFIAGKFAFPEFECRFKAV